MGRKRLYHTEEEQQAAVEQPELPGGVPLHSHAPVAVARLRRGELPGGKP